MVNDIPVIPVTEGVDWYQYNTKDLTGWVTKSDPYARPAAYETPDWGVMLLHLKPKGQALRAQAGHEARGVRFVAPQAWVLRRHALGGDHAELPDPAPHAGQRRPSP